MILGGSKAGSVDEPLLVYRLRQGSVSSERIVSFQHRVDMLEHLRTNRALRDDDLSALDAALSRHRRTLALAKALDAAQRGDGDARKLALAVARDESHGRKTRLKAAVLAAAPSSARPLARRPARLPAAPVAPSGWELGLSLDSPTNPQAEGEDAAAATTGASVLRGGSWNLIGLFVPQLALLVLSVAAARFLGPDQFGRQSFIAFVEVSVVMLLAGGLPLALTRLCGRRARQAAARRRDRPRPLGRPDIDRGRGDRCRDHGRLRAGGRNSAGRMVHRGSRRGGVADPTRSLCRAQRAPEVEGRLGRGRGDGRRRRGRDGPRALGRRRDRRHVRGRGRRDAREPRLALVAVAPRRGRRSGRRSLWSSRSAATSCATHSSPRWA